MKIKELLRYYKSRNVTILFSSHVIEFLDNFMDHCILLKDGEVMEDAPVKSFGSLRELYVNHVDRNDLTLPFAWTL
jgi:ABC-type multidrug transport system ATPase subunit